MNMSATFLINVPKTTSKTNGKVRFWFNNSQVASTISLSQSTENSPHLWGFGMCWDSCHWGKPGLRIISVLANKHTWKMMYKHVADFFQKSRSTVNHGQSNQWCKNQEFPSRIMNRTTPWFSKIGGLPNYVRYKLLLKVGKKHVEIHSAVTMLESYNSWKIWSCPKSRPKILVSLWDAWKESIPQKKIILLQKIDPAMLLERVYQPLAGWWLNQPIWKISVNWKSSPK